MLSSTLVVVYHWPGAKSVWLPGGNLVEFYWLDFFLFFFLKQLYYWILCKTQMGTLCFLCALWFYFVREVQSGWNFQEDRSPWRVYSSSDPFSNSAELFFLLPPASTTKCRILLIRQPWKHNHPKPRTTEFSPAMLPLTPIYRPPFYLSWISFLGGHESKPLPILK